MVTQADRVEALFRRIEALLKGAGVSPRRFRGLSLSKFAEVATEGIQERDLEKITAVLAILGKFLQDLERVRDADPALFSYFVRRLSRDDKTAYLGTRFEIGTASAFFCNEIAFSRPEEGGPASVADFIVPTPHGEVHVECTVPRIESSQRVDLPYKVHAAIAGKARKNLPLASTIVFVDATQLEYTAYRDDKIPPMHSAYLESDLKRQLTELGLGGAVVFLYQLRRLNGTTRFERNYGTVLGEASTEAASWFLEQYFPKNRDMPEGGAVPSAL